MNKHSKKIRKQAGLLKAIYVSLLIVLPAMPVVSVALPLNPRPSIFNEAPYNRSGGTHSWTCAQPPPEEQQALARWLCP